MRYLSILFLLVAPIDGLANTNQCLKWFIDSGLVSQSKNCSLKCAMTPVDMQSFDCPSQCGELCSKSALEQILSYAPRLTEGDKKVIARLPVESYRVYWAKEEVNSLATKIFKNLGREDESDAFRHFVWSALLVDKVGEEKARIFLSAHEEDSTQSDLEKKMDIFNNEQGLQFAVARLKAKKSLSIEVLEREALERLRDKKLKVNKEKLKKIPGGYYSQ